MKKFIRDFVKELIVYKDHIEVTFKVVFLIKNRKGEVKVTSSIKRYDLLIRYSDSFYIKVSWYFEIINNRVGYMRIW